MSEKLEMEQLTVGFVGVGNMASAILNGVLSAGVVVPAQIGLYDISSEHMEAFVKRGCVTFPSIDELVKQCKIVVLAVKPQQFSDILPLVKKGMSEQTVLVSIAAGITPQRIRDEIGFDCKLVLAMPNTPLLVGAGATALACVEPITRAEFQQVKSLFETAGIVEEIPVEKISDSIPIHGSSPAFLYEFARIIAQCADQVGIDQKTAIRLVGQTLIGSGKMLLESGYSPEELTAMVCSPGGTTVAGMAALKESGFEQAIENAFSATIWRGQQLAGASPLREGVSIVVVEYASQRYEEAKELRRIVLREPLGLDILETDEEGDVDAVHICAIIEDAVVGTCQLKELDVFTVKMGQVAVDPSLQKSGIGAMLMWEGDQVASKKGYTRMTLDSRMSAKSFYMRQGYQARGGSYLIHGIPHVAMYKNLKVANIED